MDKYKYILFDLDGTVTDSAPGITNSVKYALRKSKAELPSYEVLCKFIGPPLIDGFRELCGFDTEKANAAVGFYREYYSVTGIFENRVYDGIPELLKRLRKNGKEIILATSKPQVFAERILEHFSLDQYFDLTVGASLDETRNSKDKVIAHALSEYGICDKSAAIMVGDRFHDIIGAEKNGIDSVGVLYGFGDRKELEAAKADYIAENISKLFEILI